MNKLICYEFVVGRKVVTPNAVINKGDIVLIQPIAFFKNDESFMEMIHSLDVDEDCLVDFLVLTPDEYKNCVLGKDFDFKYSLPIDVSELASMFRLFKVKPKKIVVWDDVSIDQLF